MTLEDRAKALASRRKVAQAAIVKELKALGLEFRTCGTKNLLLPDGAIDASEGTWAGTSVKTKPQRWILRFSQGGGALKARPAEIDDNESRIGYFNLRTNTVGAVGIRVLPAIQDANAEWQVLQDREWFLVLVFEKPLDAGTSGDAFDFDLTTGVVRCQEKHLPLKQMYLIGLSASDEEISQSAPDVTFAQCTEALKRMLLQAESITPPPKSEGDGENNV